ncbi:MAG: hypothetical protein HKN85_09745 [Gammaproteobacteria bacterium]|nr:hypothetical protein [Gammaproteobacteria bacterium]
MPSNYSRTSLYSGLVLALAILLTTVLYWAGLHGGLYFDDSHVLLQNEFIRVEQFSFDAFEKAANSFLAGGREISMLSFAINYYFFGDAVFWFKAVNLGLHILNGLLILLLVYVISESPLQRVATDTASRLRFRQAGLFATVLWLLAPINLGAVLYISQRMTLLAFMFVTLGLIAHVCIRSSFRSRAIGFLLSLVSAAVFTFLAFHSKENGILLPGYIALVEVFGLNGLASIGLERNKSVRRRFLIWIAIGVLCVGLLLVVWPVVVDRISYGGRDFTMYERVLTQFRAIGFYLSQILVPNNNELSMWHDDIRKSTGLLSPVTTLIGLVLVLALIALAAASLRNKPIIGFCIAWFFLGHSLESTIFPLEMMHEHRNYYASFGILLGVCYLLLSLERVRISIRLAIIAGLVLLNAGVLHARSAIWSNDVEKARHEAIHHPGSPLAQFSFARYLYKAAVDGDQGAVAAAKSLLEKNLAQEESNISNESLLLILSSMTSIKPDPAWVDSAIRKLAAKGYNPINSRAIAGVLEHVQSPDSTLPLQLVAPLFDYIGGMEDSRLITFSAIFNSEVTQDYETAMKLFQKAARNAPNNANFATNLLRGQIKTRQYPEACTNYSRILEMDEEKRRLLKRQLDQAAEWLKGKC